MGLRVLVTGATGFIGSHLVEALEQAGHEVRALAHYRSSGQGWQGDVTDRDSMVAAVAGVDIVCHLAALIDVPYSLDVPESYIRTNTLGTLNVLEACLEHEAKLIFANSSESYGTVGGDIDENQPQQAQSPYAASKIGAMQLCQAYSYRLPIVCLTMFNVYGPRQSDRAVIPRIIRQLLRGPHVVLGDITTERDFTHVSDTCAAWLRAIAWLQAGGGELNLNIGSGNACSIKMIAETIAELMQKPLTIFTDTRLHREGYEVRRLNANNELARKVLGWEPKLSLREGLQRTIDWYAKQC